MGIMEKLRENDMVKAYIYYYGKLSKKLSGPWPAVVVHVRPDDECVDVVILHGLSLSYEVGVMLVDHKTIPDESIFCRPVNSMTNESDDYRR